VTTGGGLSPRVRPVLGAFVADEAQTSRLRDRGELGSAAESTEDAPDVIAHGHLGERQLLRDRPGLHAVGEHHQDLPLSRRERRDVIVPDA
jgi:hypothetical protein